MHSCLTAARLLFACCVLIFSGELACAHHGGAPQRAPADAIRIPNLAHGQMTVIAAHRTAILDLADGMPRTDPPFRRLRAFINLQFSGCLWGLMPGSVTDEDSPFNECAHAYLAATRALLMHMKTMPDRQDEVRALVTTIDGEMAARGSSLAMCRYSDEPFDTSQRVSPRWTDVVFHAPSLLALVGAWSMGIGVLWLLLGLTRQPPRVAVS